jgi:hypothetical protein
MPPFELYALDVPTKTSRPMQKLWALSCHLISCALTTNRTTALNFLHCRDLKARLETLGAQLSNAASASALEERALAAEGRAKALAASLGRKDAALREAQAAATALKVQLSEAAQQAASGDVQAAAARLKAELGRKEAALQVGWWVLLWGGGVRGGLASSCGWAETALSKGRPVVTSNLEQQLN